jgi:hypothetical protein
VVVVLVGGLVLIALATAILLFLLGVLSSGSFDFSGPRNLFLVTEVGVVTYVRCGLFLGVVGVVVGARAPWAPSVVDVG